MTATIAEQAAAALDRCWIAWFTETGGRDTLQDFSLLQRALERLKDLEAQQ
jgi:hypothetical protein